MLRRHLPEGSRERADCGTGGWSPWWSSCLSSYTAWCRCPGGREAHLQQCHGQFARPFAELFGCQRCCFQTKRWCSRSGCSPQCRCRRIWGYWGSFQTSSVLERRVLMWLLQHCICVSRPCEILGDVNAEELIAVNPLHRCLVDGDGCVFSALSPEIHTSSLVLSMLSERWFSWHHLVRVLTSSL